MILAKNILSKNDFLEAKKQGVNTILFNEIVFTPEEQIGIEFYNCTAQRVSGTWWSWYANERIIDQFKSKFPQFFIYNGYDLSLAIKKAMFWSNQKTGYLYESIERNFKHKKIYYAEPMHSVNKWKVIAKYLKYIFQQKLNQSKVVKTTTKGKQRIGLQIKNNFQLGFYAQLLKDLEGKEDFVVFVDETIDIEGLSNLNLHHLSNTIEHKILPIINPFTLSNEELLVLDIVLSHWSEFGLFIQHAEEMSSTGIKRMLINEAENGHYGACVSEVFKKNGIETFNTMNGMKSGEAQDAFINFDKWFVWDEQMKQMMVDKNKLNPSKFIVSGHLVEDRIRQQTFKDSLKLDKSLLKNKKVISLFSVRGKLISKIEAMDYLYNLIKDSEDYFLIIRPHPSEKRGDFILPEKSENNVLFVDYTMDDSSETLYDQLYLTDVAIVFGSTVSLDCKWLNIPCITFEIRDESMIYCTDNENIIHVKDLEALDEKLHFLLNKSSNRKPDLKENVSKFIIDTLLEIKN